MTGGKYCISNTPNPRYFPLLTSGDGKDCRDVIENKSLYMLIHYMIPSNKQNLSSSLAPR